MFLLFPTLLNAINSMFVLEFDGFYAVINRFPPFLMQNSLFLTQKPEEYYTVIL